MLNVNKKCAIGVLINIKKTFDLVDPQLLYKKLNFMEFAEMHIIESLDNRSQFVTVDGYTWFNTWS